MSGFRMPHCFLPAALAVLLTPALTLAAGGEAPRQHDGGFFLRLSGGPGVAGIQSYIRNASPGDDFGNGTKVEVTSSGGDGNLAIGAVVSPNLAVHGTLWGWSASDPTLKQGGLKQTARDLTLSMNAVGAGITWYFGRNFYLSGSLGAATLRVERDRIKVDSSTGGAIDITLGKEWWVGRRWGLGVAAGLGAVSIPTDDPTLDDRFSGNSFGVRLTATYN